MLTEYIKAAMRRAHYKILEDGTFFGEIEGFPGLWSNASSLEEARDELKGGLEEWIVLGLKRGDAMPMVGGAHLHIFGTVDAPAGADQALRAD